MGAPIPADGGRPVLALEQGGKLGRIVEQPGRLRERLSFEAADGASVPPGLDATDEPGRMLVDGLAVVRGELDPTDDPRDRRSARTLSTRRQRPEAERVSNDEICVGSQASTGRERERRPFDRGAGPA